MALWGLLAATPQTALGYGAVPAIRGAARLDAVVANNVSVEQRCLNDGSGSFTACSSFNTTDISPGVALGDLQGDGPDGNLVEVTAKFVGGVTTSNFGLTMLGLPPKPVGLVALYQFDAKYCNQSADTLNDLRSRTVQITQNNTLRFEDFTLPADKDKFLSAPEWREGGIGAELVISTAGQTFGYADGNLAPGECAVIAYKFNLFSLSRYQFGLRLYGAVGGGPDALPDSLASTGSSNDLSATPVAAIELDLGALQATTETPPITLPGGTAPTPSTPTLSFPSGISSLPSRR